jgi:hypothetical protein
MQIFLALEMVSLLLKHFKKYLALHLAGLGVAVASVGLAFFVKKKKEEQSSCCQ